MINDYIMINEYKVVCPKKYFQTYFVLFNKFTFNHLRIA